MSQDKDNNEAASAPALHDVCKACDGEGVIHTGIDEAPTTQCRKCDGSGFAHVARQRQESAAVAEGVDTALPSVHECIVHIYPSDLARMAATETTATTFSVAVGCPEEESVPLYTAEQVATHGAQQREAGRQSQIARIRHLEHERDEARAALASQPVSEGLMELSHSLLESCANWLESRSNTVWATQFNHSGLMRSYATGLRALSAAPPATQPVPMILHCPACGLQHIDAPDERTEGWENPPHRSHLCHGCGHVFRPADVPTEGVAAIQTRGSKDSPAPPAKAEGMSDTDILNWLERKVVNVRDQLRYGSRDLFWSTPVEVEGELDDPSDLRAACRAAILAQQAQGAAE